MTCKAIAKHLCIPVTNIHSDRNFVISFLNSCSLPIISFFKVIAPYYGNTPRIVSLNSPNVSIRAYTTKPLFPSFSQLNTQTFLMSAFSAVTLVHLSKTFVIGYVRFLSTLTFAVNGPFGYIPQMKVSPVGEPTAALL